MKSGALPKHGLRFNGVLYTHEASESVPSVLRGGAGLSRWVVLGRKEPLPAAAALAAGVTPEGHWWWQGGIVMARTSRALVVATFSEDKGHEGAVCRAAVEGLASFMTDYAC